MVWVCSHNRNYFMECITIMHVCDDLNFTTQTAGILVNTVFFSLSPIHNKMTWQGHRSHDTCIVMMQVLISPFLSFYHCSNQWNKWHLDICMVSTGLLFNEKFVIMINYGKCVLEQLCKYYFRHLLCCVVNINGGIWMFSVSGKSVETSLSFLLSKDVTADWMKIKDMSKCQHCTHACGCVYGRAVVLRKWNDTLYNKLL